MSGETTIRSRYLAKCGKVIAFPSVVEVRLEGRKRVEYREFEFPQCPACPYREVHMRDEGLVRSCDLKPE